MRERDGIRVCVRMRDGLWLFVHISLQMIICSRNGLSLKCFSSRLLGRMLTEM